MRTSFLTVLVLCGLMAACELLQPGIADDRQAGTDQEQTTAAVRRVVAAVGGEEKLLKLFQIRESVNVNEDPEAKRSERVSVLEPPRYWWVGKTERVKDEKEPAIYLVWAWTLRALTDPESKLSRLPDIDDQGVAGFGLRVSGTIDPPLDLYFDSQNARLLRIDWRDDTHRFSDWKELDGLIYPSRTVGFHKEGKEWYHSDILELTRLQELPSSLSR